MHLGPEQDQHPRSAELELRHIQLELESGFRARHMRHFIDQYYCYWRGYVTASGRPRWNDVRWRGYVSVAAAASLDTPRELRPRVVRDHLVPLTVIISKLQTLPRPVTLQDIRDVLRTYTHFGTILQSEDRELRRAGLRSTMPEAFDLAANVTDPDVFLVRYAAVGIGVERRPF